MPANTELFGSISFTFRNLEGAPRRRLLSRSPKSQKAAQDGKRTGGHLNDTGILPSEVFPREPDLPAHRRSFLFGFAGHFMVASFRACCGSPLLTCRRGL